jgi:uncharacterized membrane protein
MVRFTTALLPFFVTVYVISALILLSAYHFSFVPASGTVLLWRLTAMFLILTVTAYTRASQVSPGIVSAAAESSSCSSAEDNSCCHSSHPSSLPFPLEPISTVVSEAVDSPSLKLHCEHCGTSLRPERTHHCFSLDACILRYDHYCVWIDNAVGYYNYRLFFSFVFCSMAAAVSYCALIFTAIFSGHSLGIGLVGMLGTFFLLCIAATVAISLSVFLCISIIPCIVHNQTAVERAVCLKYAARAQRSRRGPYVHRYDCGSWYKNAVSMLQSDWPWMWILPFGLPRPFSAPPAYPWSPLWDASLEEDVEDTSCV